MKIKGLKKAIGDFNRANADGMYSPHYGVLMFNKSTGEIWCDKFYDIGHNSWKEYHDENIINISYMMCEVADGEVKFTTEAVKEFINQHFD